nr:immunoglobulin heavy chain junction region [Mus musculus]
CTTAHFDYW